MANPSTTEEDVGQDARDTESTADAADWAALGRSLAAEDREVYQQARAIVAELVARVRARSACKRASLFGLRGDRPTA